MTFPELVKKLKGIPFDEIRRESRDYFEFVVSSRHLTQIHPLFESYYGPAFKPAGTEPNAEAQNISKSYGGVQTQQTLYYMNSGDGISDCAMIWPWNDGTHVTIKMSHGKIAAVKEELEEGF